MYGNTSVDLAMAQMGEIISVISFMLVFVSLVCSSIIIACGTLKEFLRPVLMTLFGGLIGLGTVGISDSLAGNLQTVATAGMDTGAAIFDFLTSSAF